MKLLEELQELYRKLRKEKKERFNRYVPFGDLFTDRWDIAKFYGFGEGTSCYDNVIILGDVKVGKNTWIGPNVILDGRGGLEIGDGCNISAGVHIYTHQTVDQTITMGKEPMKTAPTKIGSGVYIGPQSVITMGVTIGDRVAVGAMSFVDKDVPTGKKAWGIPAKVQK